MDTQKLTTLALEGDKDKIKEYRQELIRKINNANVHLMHSKNALGRVKLIPGVDETVVQLTKEIEMTEKSIQDAYNTVNIIDNWKY